MQLDRQVIHAGKGFPFMKMYSDSNELEFDLSKIKNDLIVSESQNLLTCKMVELFDWEPLQSMKFMPHRQFCPGSM